MEDSFLIKPSSKEVVVSADQIGYQNYVKNQNQKTNDDYNVLIERQMMAAAPVLLLGAPLNAMKHFSDQQNCSPE